MDNERKSKVYVLATISNGQRYIGKAFSNYLVACDYMEDTADYFKEQGYTAPEIQRITDPFDEPKEEPTLIEVYRMTRGADLYLLELYKIEPIGGLTKNSNNK